jgi:hypothetical protein
MIPARLDKPVFTNLTQKRGRTGGGSIEDLLVQLGSLRNQSGNLENEIGVAHQLEHFRRKAERLDTALESKLLCGKPTGRERSCAQRDERDIERGGRKNLGSCDSGRPVAEAIGHDPDQHDYTSALGHRQIAIKLPDRRFYRTAEKGPKIAKGRFDSTFRRACASVFARQTSINFGPWKLERSRSRFLVTERAKPLLLDGWPCPMECIAIRADCLFKVCKNGGLQAPLNGAQSFPLPQLISRLLLQKLQ